jgi:electron transport complex protein RnfG
MKDILRAVLIVFLVCGAAAGSLSFVNQSTREKIAEQARLEREEAMKQVYPQAAGFREKVPGQEWEAEVAGAAAGTVVAATARGYGGPIALMVGVDAGKRVTGVRVLRHTETPGLGARITAESFLAQFAGKTGPELKLKKDDHAAGRIDAITAATISSRAVSETIRSVADGGK